MVILHIAYLDSDKAVGPNINVVQNIKYGNNYQIVGLYNLRSSKLAIKVQQDRVFNYEDHNSITDLPEPFNKPDIVIFQGVYFMKYCQIAKYLTKEKIPYIIVPRCSMTDAAIKNKYIKKKIANLLFFNKFIKKASSIQFLTENECYESKKNFKFADYYILGNGIEFPSTQYQKKTRDEFKIVFVGRYNVYHKGLDILLNTVNQYSNWFTDNNVTINLYGRDSESGEVFIKNYILNNKLDKIVKLNGPTYNNEKENVLLDADIFIHTSRLEGQPTAVMEAISYGIPVIVTPGTNVKEMVEKNELGFTCQLTNESIFECIKMAFDNKNEFTNISKKEIMYSKHHFDWNNIIKESIKEYERIIMR